MKKIFYSVIAVVLASCGTPVNEAEVVANFEKSAKGFSVLMGNNDVESDVKEKKLKASGDSLLQFVALIETNFPKSASLPTMYAELGEKCMNLSDGPNAVKFFNKLIEGYPEHTSVPKSMYLLGHTYQTVINDVEKAKEVYIKLARRQPFTQWNDIARSEVQYINNPTSIVEETIQNEPESNSETK